MRLRPVAATALAVLATASDAAASTPFEVDPLLGTSAPGNTAPGAQVPFGFADPGPDTTDATTAGYGPNGMILGFSQTHVSGTGGASRYGNFRVTPLIGCPGRDAVPSAAALAQARSDERATPGFYGVTLRPSGVRAMLSATRRVAVHRYTFPRATRVALLLDPGSVVLPDAAGAQRPLRQWATTRGTQAFDGGATVTGGWGVGRYTLLFSAALRHPTTTLRTVAGRDGRLRVLACFDARRDPVVQLKVALSFRSTAVARRTLRTETPGWDFAAVRRRARDAWRAGLAPVQVDGGTRAQRTMLATALYHAQLMPHDLSGENRWWRSRQDHYEDFYALWDTFRTVNPLLTLIAPRREAALVRSLLDTERHMGGLPDARVAGNDGVTQVGSSADVVLADAIVKRLGGFDRRAALQALLRDAAVSARRPFLEGRQQRSYARRGWIPVGERASVSRTLEYAYGDFAVGEAARALGDRGDARRYLARSASWRNLWDPVTLTVRARAADGAFVGDFDPRRLYRGWTEPYFEGSAVQWSTFVPHDVDGLVRRVGGEEAFVGWLDRLFAGGPGGYDPGNEPDLLAPYLYLHVGRPGRTDALVRGLIARWYGAGRRGLPGNDDSGTLSAWYAWGAIGLFPNAGQPYYYVGSPLFRRTILHLPAARTFTIDAPATSATRRFVTGAWLNGRPLCRAFVTHGEVAAGGRLLLAMSDRPGSWGRCQRPPSLSGGG